MILFCII